MKTLFFAVNINVNMCWWRHSESGQKSNDC